MSVSNAQVLAALGEIADLLEIDNANPFRVRAYRNAARTLAELGWEIRAAAPGSDTAPCGEPPAPCDPEARLAALDALPGIGPDLAQKIATIADTGSCSLLTRLRQRLSPGTAALLKVPGLGPGRVRSLHQALGIETLEQLRQAARQGRIQSLPGFGPRSEQKILDAADSLLKQDMRYRRDAMEPLVGALVASLEHLPGMHQVLAVGSLRRGQETVGDLDLLLSCDVPAQAMAHMVRHAEVQQVLEHGPTRCRLVLRAGVQLDVRAVAPVSLGAAALYFTGSKAHNIALRRMAQGKGLRLNEYGLFRGSQRIAGDTEAAVYAGLGLPLIPPELRENRGEIAAAREGRLPRLVQRADLQGDLHAHSQDSDGADSLERLAQAARAQGLHYLAVTDHAQHMAVVHGLDAEGLARQIDRIDAFNATQSDIVLLKGVEVDILEDGRLALPDALLRRLDLVVGAVHSGFGQSRDKQTERLLRAMDHPCFSLLAHPSARLINQRAPCAFDLLRVLRKARERGCYLELNAQPMRLDLTDTACRMAKSEGVRISINSDAHRASQFSDLHYGISQARRGWLEPDDVLNTRTLAQLRPLLKATMA